MRVESLQQGRSSRGLLSRLTFSTLHAGRVAATPNGNSENRFASTLSVPSMRVESLQPGCSVLPGKALFNLSVPSMRVESLQRRRAALAATLA